MVFELFIADYMIRIYSWLWLSTFVGWTAFGHLWRQKKGIPCYMAYLTLMMFSVWLMSNIMIYARYLRLFDPGAMNAFAYTPLWYARWVPFCLITSVASAHVVYKNYIWKGYNGVNRRAIDRRGGIK